MSSTMTVVTEDDELVGLWDDSAYGYGAMESSTLALLPDGTGWGTWENAAGGAELVDLTWSRIGPDVFSVHELQIVSGCWDPERPGTILYEDAPSALADVTQVRYELVDEAPFMASEPVLVLRLDQPLMFARAYALSRRVVTPEDRPVARDAGYDQQR